MKRVIFSCLMAWLLAALVLSIAKEQAPAEPPAPKPTAAVQKILDEASQFVQAKQPQEALRAADRALAMARKTKDPVGEAQAHRSRALALQSLGRTEETITAWREAATAWERAGDGPRRVEAMAEIALLFATREPAKADSLFAQALALSRAEMKRPLAAAATLNRIGVSYAQRGFLNRARELFEAGLVIREKLAPDSLDVAASLTNLGLVAGQQGDLAAAGDHLRRALAIKEKLAPDSLDVAKSLTNLGNMARLQGDLAAARDYYRRALAIFEGLAPNSLEVAAGLNNLGVVADIQGDLAAAGEYHQRSLAIKEKLAPDSLDMAASLGNLGNVARQQGDLAAAGEYYRRALAIDEKLAPDSLDVAKSLTNLGLVAGQQGDLAAAGDYLRRALAIQEKLAPDSLDVAKSLTNLGNVARLQGDLAAAGDYLRRALAIKEKLAPDSLDVARSLGNLAEVASAQGDLTKAERLARRAWELVRQQATAVTGDEARQAFGTSTAEYAAHLVRYQLALGKVGPAFITAEEARAQALQQLMIERQLLASATNRQRWSEYQAAASARDRAEQAVSRASVVEALARRDLAAKQEEHAASDLLAKAQAALQTATKRFEAAQSAYTQARVQADALWADIKKNAPRGFAAPLTMEQAHQAVPAGILFVAFSVGEEQTHVFLLRSTGRESPLSVHTVAITAKELQTLVRALRIELTDPESGVPSVAAASRALFAKLFPKEAQVAMAEAQRLLISPDGPLWDVPFAALVTNHQGAPRYLGEEKAITYTQSLTLFAQSRNDAPQLAKGSPPSTVVVGNPIFDRKTALAAAAVPKERLSRGERSYFFIDDKPPDPLPGTKTEAVEIAQLYGSVPLIEEKATEAALRERIDKADVIHLATHGYLHPVRAMSSGVLLTVPEKEPEVGETNNDGALQAWEIYSQLKLKAELVVLSACETGRGQNVRGEGLIGLTRALQYAGARSIIASQWRVADESTTRLMVALHRHLRKGLAKDEALRQAMVLLRKEKRTSHPYYWAPFFLTGDPDNPNLGALAKEKK